MAPVPQSDNNNAPATHGDVSTLPAEMVLQRIPHPTLPNEFGTFVADHYSALLDGTNGDANASSYKKESKIDVVVVGAGPTGLEVAASLARQGFRSRVIDKAPTPLVAGRGNGVQPRFLEIAQLWGLQSEFTEVGPIIEHTAIYMDGKCKLYTSSHLSESPFKGLHLVTQPQIERIWIRDLRRHGILVERPVIMTSYEVSDDASEEYPVTCQLSNVQTGETETVRAKYLVGADGAHSSIRRKMNIEFPGITADIYWGVLDAPLDSDWPHAWMFGVVLHSEHGGVIVVPRENGIVRLYVQIRPEQGKGFDKASITPELILQVANKVFSPYTIRFSGPTSWHLGWQINERVADAFSGKNNRVFLAGDACHCHSAMGAFGLNAGIMDSANLSFKLGLCLRGAAKPDVVLPTYDVERRTIANRLVRTSARYLRIVTMDPFGTTGFKTTIEEELGEAFVPPRENMTDAEKHYAFLLFFLKKNSRLLIGLDIPYVPNEINSDIPGVSAKVSSIRAGIRAPNPRVALTPTTTGYLYHALQGNPGAFHALVFAGYLTPAILSKLDTLEAHLASGDSFYSIYSHEKTPNAVFPENGSLINPVILVRSLPSETKERFTSSGRFPHLSKLVKVIYDDSLSPEDVHTAYGVDPLSGGVVVLRPDSWVGTSTTIDRPDTLKAYFSTFMLPAAST
ncbi:unnamed protein product [Tilletia controversa]|nr:unnamed protein product [Tilletia controversa]CAD6937909.1 unnamed protein product [Tilletia controversa]